MRDATDNVPILKVDGLTTEFRTPHGLMRAVDGVSFEVHRGEVLGLVGESGSGKSVTGYSIMGLIDPPGEIIAGKVSLGGMDVRGQSAEWARSMRGNRIAMIFQDPMSSLHPMLSIGTQVTDAITAHRSITRRQAQSEARDALARVGIPAPETRLKAYPHELSGGMRQRVAIAIAMINSPDVIIADEPTTGLDVTIQAQILYEMQKLITETGTALIWITHDLSVVAGLADRIAVMYAGRIVEQGPIAQVIDTPAHPYTAGLLASVPSRNKGSRLLPQMRGSIGGAHALPGCRFAPRCAFARAGCTLAPELTEVSPGHFAACVVAGRFEQTAKEISLV